MTSFENLVEKFQDGENELRLRRDVEFSQIKSEAILKIAPDNSYGFVLL